MYTCRLLICFGVQWLGFLSIDQKVMGSNPGRSKEVFFLREQMLIGKPCVSAGTQKYGSRAQPSHVKNKNNNEYNILKTTNS